MAAEGKKKGRRTKLPMKFIPDPKQRCVSFSKRKKGLFGKCAALCSMFSGAIDIAAVVFSQHGKVFSFGHPSPDGVLHRYLNVHGGAALPANSGQAGFWWDDANVGEMNLEELESFKSSLEELRIRVLGKVFDLEIGGSTSDQIKSRGSIDDSTNQLLGFDDLFTLEDLGIVNNQQNCDQYLGDGGLMDIFYDHQR